MVTSGNGIPDEFETAYSELLDELWEIDPNDEDLTDVDETQGYKLMAGFYDRLPVASSTKATLASTAEIFEKLAASESLEKQQELVDKIRAEEEKILDADPVYVDVKGYIASILSSQAGSGSGEDTGSGSSAWSEGRLVGQALSGHEGPTALNVDVEDEEGNINRLGDLIFKETSSGYRSSFSPLYTMRWDHVAMYAGDAQIYDAHPNECPDTSDDDDDDDDGVGFRSLERLYEEADSVMYSQLANSSWRWSVPGALSDAQDEYGTDCSIPFTRNPFAMSGTSKFFCSKLIWRAYLDNDNYSVNVDSNAAAYHYWLQDRYGPLPAAIIINTVAPDEIALSPNVDDYRTLD